MEQIPDLSQAQRRRSWIAGGLAAAIVGGIVWFYTFLAISHTADPFSFPHRPTDYYHYQIEGFMAGQLAMTIKPDPELATLADPYEPLERVRIGHPGLADASYYHGRYYLYFGVAPAVTWFLPFYLLTGLYFPSELECALFCAGGFLISLKLFLEIRRRHFPRSGSAVVWLGALMLGLGNFCVVMLTRSQFYEVPISSAYFFSCLGLWAVFRAFPASPGKRRWFLLASAAFGMAVASRPHFIFPAAVVLAGVLLWRWIEQFRFRATGKREIAWDALALAVPLGLTLVGLFAYNYLRFDSPFDFGQKYQLGGSNQPKMTLMAAGAVPVNFYYYFLAPAQVHRYFPFFDVAKSYPGTTPSYYYGIEDPFGVLPNMPCFWLVFLVPVGWFIWHRKNRELGWQLFFLSGCFATICGFTLIFVSATNRYMVDFLPPLLLIAGVGLLMAGEIVGRASVPTRILLRTLLVGLVGYTAFFNAMAAFQHNGLFRYHQPAAFDHIGRWLNRPTGWWERHAGYRYGPVELTVKLSRKSIGTNEPLVVTGSGVNSDFLYLYYTNNDLIQIGFTHMGGGPADALTSPPIPLDYDEPHQIGVQMGSLYPPGSHPYFAGFSRARTEAAKKTLEVTIDGVPYVQAKQTFHDASPALVSFGHNHISDYAGREFRGERLEVRRAPLPPAIEPFTGGGSVLVAFVPPATSSNRREPLIATGMPGAGDILFVDYEDESHLRLGFHHAGSDVLLSEPLPIQAGQVQRLMVSFGSFYSQTKGSAPPNISRVLFAKLNNSLVWSGAAEFFPSGDKPPAFGVNSWNSDACSAAFTGKIVAVQGKPIPPVPDPAAFVFKPYWIESTAPLHGAVRMHLEFPQDRTGKFEPLLVTGSSVSTADYLWVQYVEGGRIILGYEHTGGGGPRALFPLDLKEPHVLEVELPSLFSSVADMALAGRSILEVQSLKSRAQIKIDGVSKLAERVKAFESPARDIQLGENRVSAAFGERFTGKILRVERGLVSPPPGFLEKSGPLEIVFDPPAKRPTGKEEMLLSSGTKDAVDALAISYLDSETVRFVLRTHDGRNLTSAPIRLGPTGSQTLRIDWGAFQSEDGRTASASAPSHSVGVTLNGAAVLTGHVDFLVGRPLSVEIGAGAGAPFSGAIHSVQRLDARNGQ